MSLLLIAYPTIAEGDFRWIQQIRVRHDRLQYGNVGSAPKRGNLPLSHPAYPSRVIKDRSGVTETWVRGHEVRIKGSNCRWDRTDDQ
jgi:hypothetical protein